MLVASFFLAFSGHPVEAPAKRLFCGTVLRSKRKKSAKIMASSNKRTARFVVIASLALLLLLFRCVACVVSLRKDVAVVMKFLLSPGFSSISRLQLAHARCFCFFSCMLFNPFIFFIFFILRSPFATSVPASWRWRPPLRQRRARRSASSIKKSRRHLLLDLAAEEARGNLTGQP